MDMEEFHISQRIHFWPSGLQVIVSFRFIHVPFEMNSKKPSITRVLVCGSQLIVLAPCNSSTALLNVDQRVNHNVEMLIRFRCSWL